MKKIIFGLIFLFGSTVFAEGGLSQLLGLPDGISMHWSGSIIADGNYSVVQTKAGKTVQFKKEDNIVIKTNKEGAPTSVTFQDKSSPLISYVNLVPGSESATRCMAQRNISLRKEFKHCITVDKKSCAALLKMTGSKDLSEFADKVDVCSKLAESEQKAQMRGVLNVEKSNTDAMMKSLDMVWTDYSHSTTQNFLNYDKAASVDPNVNRQYSYLRWAGYMCSAEVFSQDGFQAPTRVNFDRKGAQ